MKTTNQIDDAGCGAEHRLPHGAVLTLSRAAGMLIGCDAGRLWITEEGVAADFVLAPGQRYAVRGAGKVVVEAVVGDAAIALSLRAA